MYCLISVIVMAGATRAAGPTKTQINDVVYRADGSTARGTLLISWPAFATADNKAVAAGTMSMTIGDDGLVSLGLAPNDGATPAGTYYKVVFKLDDAIAQKDIIDPEKFQDGLGKIIDGVVECLNASAWAKAK